MITLKSIHHWTVFILCQWLWRNSEGDVHTQYTLTSSLQNCRPQTVTFKIPGTGCWLTAKGILSRILEAFCIKCEQRNVLYDNGAGIGYFV